MPPLPKPCPGASPTSGASAESTKGILGLGAGALEPRLGVGAEAVEAFALLLVAEDGEGLGDHLEGLVGVLVAVLVGVRQQGLLAVGLLDVGVGACRPHRLEVQDLVEGRHFAPPDPQHRSLLLGRALPLLVPLVVLPWACAAVAVAGVGAGGFGAGHGVMVASERARLLLLLLLACRRCARCVCLVL